MSEVLSLTLACGDYDRVQPLLSGAVCPEKLTLKCIALEPNEIFQRMLLNEEFDISEMSMSNYIMERGQGNYRFSAIPVFLSRIFRHSNIYINNNSGINAPEDLSGKTVGLSEYHTTAALWLRGMLSDEYNLNPCDIRWLTGGIEKPGMTERMKSFMPPKDVAIERIGGEQCLNEMLRTGKIDALFSTTRPSAFDNGNVRRLWPDYRQKEEEYFKRTGCFPIMHVVVIKTAVAQEAPWVAQSLYAAFDEAKHIAMGKLTKKGTLPVMIPWAFSEVEEAQALMGEDYWPYGIDSNRNELETMLRYACEQGLCDERITVEELFPFSI